jgi:outer membrane protein assembly factor BamB
MKLSYVLIIVIFLQNCSFDNKSGIWKNENTISDKGNIIFKDFESLSSINEKFDKIIPLNSKFKFTITNSITNFAWKDIYYNRANNLKNFKYNNTNQLIYKSKKIINHKINEHILFENNNLITANQKGDIVVFSINEKKIISKFNFYNKKFKNIDIKLNLIVEEGIIYVSDNVGYLYAYDYKMNKISWAKNYKIPFRSNLKIHKNILIGANQNNNLLFFNKTNGNTLKLFPTEETLVNNEFINNISANGKSLFFLNTYGSLYSINIENKNVMWFINLNQSLNLNPSNIFKGNGIVANKNKLVISSNQFTYILDSNTGSILYKFNFSSKIKPIIHNNLLHIITLNNLLVTIDLKNGEPIYSYNINKKIADHLKIRMKNAEIKNLFILNNRLFIFLKNSYLLNFNINGKLEDINKLPSKINSSPIIIDDSILFLDTKKKITIID